MMCGVIRAIEIVYECISNRMQCVWYNVPIYALHSLNVAVHTAFKYDQTNKKHSLRNLKMTKCNSIYGAMQIQIDARVCVCAECLYFIIKRFNFRFLILPAYAERAHKLFELLTTL